MPPRTAVTVPANTEATVFVPTTDPGAVTEGDGPVAQAQGVRVLGPCGEGLALRVGSGTYRFGAAFGGAG